MIKLILKKKISIMYTEKKKIKRFLATERTIYLSKIRFAYG